MTTKFFENTTEQSTQSQLFSLDTFLMAIWANNSLNMTTVAPPETVVSRNGVAPTPTVAGPYETGDAAFGSHSPTTLALWATISQILWWTVLLVSSVSLPILAHALYVMLHKFHKSNYFHFLTAMIVLDLLMLLSILFNLLSDYAFAALKGSVMCKITAFITNVTSCYSNWLWVMMFAQRFVHIFFPMHRWRGKIEDEGTFFRTLDDTPKLILITGIMAAGTQMWAPFLMTEVLILSPQGTVQGCYCGPDSTLVNKNLFKWIAAVESIWTYAMPFVITLLTDLAVLIYFPLDSSKRFTTISTEEVLTKKKSTSGSQHQLLVSNPCANSILPHCARRNSILSSTQSNCALSSAVQSLKIQSEDSIRQTHKRRQRAMRRCVALASFQLLLNLPNYVLQLVDEFSNLRLTSQQFIVFYLYADALFYLLYLSQYPMLAIYIQWLHGNYNSPRTICTAVLRQQRSNQQLTVPEMVVTLAADKTEGHSLPWVGRTRLIPRHKNQSRYKMNNIRMTNPRIWHYWARDRDSVQPKDILPEVFYR
ncbi:7 transmembrane receptor (rhodopsin family) domain-containing protein [Ditylenchus destructor]|nr:7 transmembrane receptor (rhodopsin family) domain-containing protein [Ditylenchus destructor]